jgi:hypothetical protein
MDEIMKTIEEEMLLEVIDEMAHFANNDDKKMCARFFSKSKNMNFLASVAALRQMLKLRTGENSTYSKKDIMKLNDDNKDDYYDDDVKKKQKIIFDDGLISDALKILRCNKLVSYKEKSIYKLNEQLWYRGVRYKIKSYDALKSLAPALVAYVKNDVRSMPNDFFKLLTPLNQFLLKPTSFHNTDLDLERYIYDIIDKNQKDKKATITIKTDKGPRMDVYPTAIVFHENTKKLEYRTSIEVPQTFTTDLSNVVDNPPESKVVLKQNVVSINPLVQTLSVANQTVKIQENNKMYVILAVSGMAFEYFDNIAILDNMRLITDSREIYNFLFEEKIELDKLYSSSKHKEPWSDIFLVIANDEKEQILDVIQKTLNYVKVLKPSSGVLEKEIGDRYKIFEKNSKILTTRTES